MFVKEPYKNIGFCNLANIKRNLVYNFLLSCTQVLIPLLSIPYISRVLDPEGIGRVGFIDSFTYYIVVIAEFGITVYGIREVAKVKTEPGKLNELVSELLVLHIISSLVSLIVYAAGIYLLWDKIRDTRLLFFSCSFLLANFFSCEWYFWGKERFGYIAIRSVIIRVLGLVSIFLLIERPGDYFIYYGIMVVSAVVTAAWNIFILFREVNFSFRKTNWKKHLPYVWVIYFINLIYSIPLMLDNVLLRLVSTASAVGIYSFSVKIVRIGTNLLADSFLVFLPRIVSLNRENDQLQSQQKLLQNVQLIILFAVPMGMGIFLVAEELVIVFFGNKFTGAVNDLKVLSFFPFIKGLSLFFSNPVLIAHHREKNFLKNLVWSSCFFAGAALVLGFFYSHPGACIALVITEALLLVFNYFSIKKELPGLRIFDWRTMTHAIAGSLLFIPVVYLIRRYIDSDTVRFITSIMGCFCVYVVFITFFARNSFAMNVKNTFISSAKRVLKRKN